MSVPDPTRPHEPALLEQAVAVAAEIVRQIGATRVELITVTRDRVCLQPVVLAEGEAIARALGLDVPLDHRMFVPGHTLWTGVRDGLEVQVRPVLRRPLGAVQ
ncbi:hypothetical protein [Antribacter gilvus]|uniref:hypothetical protein n=1 Tax=Antribacter gilvus TaxID=2304675 RepID=UPI000F79860F|nr:hypothetical protein [Antribacter gilvus]